MPDSLQDHWDSLKKHLLALGENWEVWTDWYEGILRGGPRNPDLEIARISFPPEDYNKPAVVNAKIKALYATPIPPQKPATVRPIEKDGLLYSDHTPIKADLSTDLAIANLMSLKEEMLDLAKSVRDKDNIDKDAAKYMEGTAKLIPDHLPDSKTIMRLLRREAVLIKYEPVVIAQWSDLLSAQYSALCSELTNVLDQFPDCREFRRQQMNSELEIIPDAELADEIAQLNHLFRSQTGRQRIDESIPLDIESIDQDEQDAVELTPDMIDTEKKLVRMDQFESTNLSLIHI